MKYVVACVHTAAQFISWANVEFNKFNWSIFISSLFISTNANFDVISCGLGQGAVTPNGELNSQQGGDPHPWVGHLHGELLQMIQDSHSHRSSRLPWKFEQLFHGHRTEPHRRVRESFGNSSTLMGCSCLDWLHMSTLQWCCNSVHVTVDLHCSSIGAHNPVVARGTICGDFTVGSYWSAPG